MIGLGKKSTGNVCYFRFPKLHAFATPKSKMVPIPKADNAVAVRQAPSTLSQAFFFASRRLDFIWQSSSSRTRPQFAKTSPFWCFCTN